VVRGRPRPRNNTSSGRGGLALAQGCGHPAPSNRKPRTPCRNKQLAERQPLLSREEHGTGPPARTLP
jgi:hypothetical protein